MFLNTQDEREIIDQYNLRFSNYELGTLDIAMTPNLVAHRRKPILPT